MTNNGPKWDAGTTSVQFLGKPLHVICTNFGKTLRLPTKAFWTVDKCVSLNQKDYQRCGGPLHCKVNAELLRNSLLCHVYLAWWLRGFNGILKHEVLHLSDAHAKFTNTFSLWLDGFGVRCNLFCFCLSWPQTWSENVMPSHSQKASQR